MSDFTNEVFHKTIGLLIANSITIEYAGYMSVIFHEQGNNGLRNKCAKTVDAVESLNRRLKVADKRVQDLIDEQVKLNADIIFSITSLDPDSQKRIYNLVRKIERENKLKQQS